MTYIDEMTVAAYLGLALLCFVGTRCIDRCFPATQVRRQQLFWIGLSLLFLMLGVNKQFKYLSGITSLFRAAAWEHGWYNDRGLVQISLIISTVFVALFLLIMFSWFIRNYLREYWLVILGSTFLLGFVSVRAVSLHLIDKILFYPFGGLQLNWLLELGGIALVATAAVRTIQCWAKKGS